MTLELFRAPSNTGNQHNQCFPPQLMSTGKSENISSTFFHESSLNLYVTFHHHKSSPLTNSLNNFIDWSFVPVEHKGIKELIIYYEDRMQKYTLDFK